MRLDAYDAAGIPLSLTGFDTGFGGEIGAGSGFGGALAIGASGRIWWNLRSQELPLSGFPFQDYLLALHE